MVGKVPEPRPEPSMNQNKLLVKLHRRRHLAGKKGGPHGDSNPGPPAPEAGIIPLDQAACVSQVTADDLSALSG